MEKPENIYKYESFCAQSLQNLKAQSLYFGSPQNFNDPYDCALYANVSDPTDEELEYFRIRYSQRPDLPEDVQTQFLGMSSEELRAKIVRATKEAVDEKAKSFFKSNGVTCFCERNDDLLMWSRYGGIYKGFCLEFSTEHEPFKNYLRPVKYAIDMPTISATSILTGDDEYIDALFCTKARSWSHEREWRIIHEEVRSFTYEPSALKAIFFGPDIESESMEIIYLIMAGQNPDVTLWQGKRSKEKFEVVFEEFFYTSHIEAKQKGLIP